MKKLCVAILLTGLICCIGLAAPGPFVRVEQTWNTGLVLDVGLANMLLTEPVGSITSAALDAYIGKADPTTLAGWWTIGAGGWIITDYLPNVNAGGGLRFLWLVNNSTIPNTAWAPYVEVGWWFGPFQLFVRLNWFKQFSENAPLGAPNLSFGATLDIWRLTQ